MASRRKKTKPTFGLAFRKVQGPKPIARESVNDGGHIGEAPPVEPKRAIKAIEIEGERRRIEFYPPEK